jgi:hypothetical protein
MPWIHRVVEHRLSSDRRLGLEQRVTPRRQDEPVVEEVEEEENRREAMRRTESDRRTGPRRAH